MKITFKSTTSLPGNIPPQIQKALNFINALPDGDVIDSESLESAIGLTRCSHRALRGSRHIIKKKSWYGNPRTIAALRKQFP